ncbi:SxtJ family membrane protein [Roseateles cellulosilyticus]|uniref:SxtJ family membrane protein n=1 Tax=Pelomonas cellulosilytica TaxID=2906762 RepID=A0ABS8Y1E3_9BURK|nr:SxtJ family membrane protein [Pelomonas sp. P8]MCE4558052.1 SxtJ family membrane protein [Pelomonas sp. P8]
MSNRVFGIVWSLILVVFSLAPRLQGKSIHLPLIGGAALLLMIALVAPKLLAWPNRGWGRFSKFMHSLVSNIALLLIYFSFFTPAALMLRIVGRNELKLKFDPTLKTYWNSRSSEEVDFTRPY